MNSTDVLKVDRILVEDRIYRLLPIRESLNYIEDDKPGKKESSYDVDDDEDDYNPDLPIIHQGDEFIATIFVPEPLIGFVIGAQFKNVKSLEQQFDAKITVPERRNQEAGITIQSSKRQSVSQAYSRIQETLNRGRFRTDFTHFVSFPVNAPKIQESFLNFKDEVLTKCKNIRGIDASIFQEPAKLHITATTLILLDKRDKENAIAILNKCTNSFLQELGEKDIVVYVQGLEIMNDDEAEVDVLYAKLRELDDDNKLQILADKIMTEFEDANLSKRNFDQVKMHTTLMNTRFRQQRVVEDGEEQRITFDAKNIMKEFGNYDFGQIVISEIHISIRYTSGPDGFYNHIYKMKLKS